MSAFGQQQIVFIYTLINNAYVTWFYKLIF